MSYHPPSLKLIQSIDDAKPTVDDTHDIEHTPCFNCGRPYDETKPLMFVRLSTGKLLWWHQNHCAFYDP